MRNPSLLKIDKLRMVGLRVSRIRKHAVCANCKRDADTMGMLHHLEMRPDQTLNEIR